jgi:hypothetical protein
MSHHMWTIARGTRLEDVMNKILATLALAGVMVSVPAFAQKICLDTRKMVRSDSKDGRTMLFKMRDGSTYVNHLQGFCPDLKFAGFIWQLHGGDTKVCEFENTFHVLQSGQICTLGKFEPTTGKQAMSAPGDANRQQAPR